MQRHFNDAQIILQRHVTENFKRHFNNVLIMFQRLETIILINIERRSIEWLTIFNIIFFMKFF